MAGVSAFEEVSAEVVLESVRCGARLPAEGAGSENECDGGERDAGAEVEVVRVGSHAATVRPAANGPPTPR